MSTKLVEEIKFDGELLAIIINSRYTSDGIEFFTPPDLSQQLAYMHHPKGKIIDAHVHNNVIRNVRYTQEVLVIKSGKLRVDFYNSDREYLESHVQDEGDVILLISGGHGFEVLEDLEMYEIKQGPFIGEEDKTRFQGVSTNEVILSVSARGKASDSGK